MNFPSRILVVDKFGVYYDLIQVEEWRSRFLDWLLENRTRELESEVNDLISRIIVDWLHPTQRRSDETNIPCFCFKCGKALNIYDLEDCLFVSDTSLRGDAPQTLCKTCFHELKKEEGEK